MKQIFLIFLLLPYLNYAQVSGIGIFKIGKNKKDVLNEIKKTTGVGLTVFTDVMEWATAKKGTQRTELVSSLDSKKAYKGIDLPGIVIDSLRQDIDIDFYSVSNISLRNIGLVFYNDTLIRIRCMGSDSIFEALKTKYNEPKLTSTTTTVKCINKLTGAFDLEEVMNKYSWNNNEANIQADYFDGFKYDDKCEKEITLELVIGDTNKWNATLAKSLQGTKINPATLKDF